MTANTSTESVLVVSEHVGVGVRVRAVCSTPEKARKAVLAIRDLYAKDNPVPADYLARFIVTTMFLDVVDDVMEEPQKRRRASAPEAGALPDMSLWFGWTGCRAELACMHYLLGDDDDPPRVTALCRACSKAYAKRMRLHARRKLKP